MVQPMQQAGDLVSLAYQPVGQICRTDFQHTDEAVS